MLDEIRAKASVVTIRLPIFKFDFLQKVLLGRIFQHFVIEPLTCFAYRCRSAELRKILEESDIIYLFNNSFSYLVSKGMRATTIGNTDSFFVWGVLGRVVSKLTYRGLLFTRIDKFHLLYDIPYWERSTKHFSIPNGVDSDLFEPRNSCDPKIKLIFAGRLEDGKGLRNLVEAWHILREKYEDIGNQIELHVAGRGSLENLVERDASIVYHGSMAHLGLGELEGKCDIFVFPSMGETFGSVVLEAASSGLYVITTESLRTIFHNLIPDEYITYVSNDPVTLAETMYEASKNIENIRGNKLKIHQFIKINFDWQTISMRLFDALLGELR